MPTLIPFATVSLATLAAIASLAACSQGPREAAPNPVKWTLAAVGEDLRAGSRATVHVAALLDTGWYIYSLTQKAGGPTPMKVTAAPSPPFRVEGNVIGPQPVVIFDKEFGIETERYEGKPAFVVPVEVASTSEARPRALDVRVRYQACNASFCLPARTTILTTAVRLTARQ